MASEQQEEESKTISLKILVDKQSNKVVFVETTNDFVDTLFSFLSLPLATIFRLLATNNTNNYQQLSESSPFLANINNLYQTVQNTTSNDVWNNPVCKEMLLHPGNPCESQCMKLFLNVNEPSSKFYVCTSCYKFTTFQNLHCACGKPITRQPENLDSKGQGNNCQNGVFVRENGSMFLVSDDLKILPSSSVTYLQLLMESGHSDSTQLEEVTHNIGKQEILNLLKYSLISHEPLTNTILKSCSKNKGNSHNPSAVAVKVVPCTSKKSKIDIKVVQSKSLKKLIFTEANGDFVDFIFSFLTIPLGSIVKLLGANSFAGCVGNLYKSVENLDPTSVLLNPGVAPQSGYPNQPLDIPHVEHPAYFYETFYIGKTKGWFTKDKSSLIRARQLIAMDPREGAVGFVKRAALYGVEDDLKVKPLSANSFLSYLNELSLSFDDLEVKVISIGEAEALKFLAAFLTSKFTLTSGLQDFLNVPKQESTLLKVPKQESTLTSK
ncbi:uncharacterized protein LOC123924876 [Trifolium pratense]|uniref:uncharacterized protein LOC123924876 n=1 Tax=Trifolium pratense TaxID=57577 RepID=UPI001E697A62|nr:uncharacterized protein LOC123924876 [Trifolium pratense]